MRKFRVFIIMLLSLSFLAAGSSIAYYNTKSFGFDEDAVLLNIDEKSITFLDFKINFSEIESIYDEAGKYFPDKTYTTYKGASENDILYRVVADNLNIML